MVHKLYVGDFRSIGGRSDHLNKGNCRPLDPSFVVSLNGFLRLSHSPFSTLKLSRERLRLRRRERLYNSLGSTLYKFPFDQKLLYQLEVLSLLRTLRKRRSFDSVTTRPLLVSTHLWSKQVNCRRTDSYTYWSDSDVKKYHYVKVSQNCT